MIAKDPTRLSPACLQKTHRSPQRHSQPCAALGTGSKKPEENTPLKINSGSKTLTIDQGKSETRKCFIGKVQKNQSLQLNLQQ